MQKIISKNVEQTLNIANKLARYLQKGDVVVLTGNLGSGKTYFTKGILQYFHDEDEVSSPTFTIVNEYSTIPPIFHFDVYRLNNSDEFLNIGGEEYIQNGICIIEWGEIIKDVLPINRLNIEINKIDDTTREITFDSSNQRYINIVKEVIDNENSCN